MSTNTKISLTIFMEGSTLVRQEEPEKIKYIIREKDLNPEATTNNIVEEGERIHYPKNSKNVKKVINISKEAYDYYKEYGGMETNMRKLMEHFQGKGFSYIILDD
jgi:hypothetical protein